MPTLILLASLSVTDGRDYCAGYRDAYKEVQGKVDIVHRNFDPVRKSISIKGMIEIMDLMAQPSKCD